MTSEGADTSEPSGQYGPFAIAVVTISLIAWPIAFNLGAFGEVFYTDVFSFVVAATAGLAVSLIANPYAGTRRWWTNATLAAPATWLLLAIVFRTSTAEAATGPILGPLALVIVVVSIPTVLRMLIDMFVPGFRSFSDRRLLVGGLAVVITISAMGYVVGANNDAFLTCQDFKVAGSDQPPNCSPR